MIRRETQEDYRAVEAMIKKAFWNINVPGCDEHYLAHVLRSQPDFIPELDLVIEEDGQIIANIMYARSTLVDEAGRAKAVLTFGPLSVLPAYQRRGHGKRLMAASFEKALALGYDAVVIFGNPENYVSSGFKGCQAYNVSLDGHVFPVALLVRELREGALAGHRWTYLESPAYGAFDPRQAEAFDKDFEPMEKAYRPSQELFSIYSRSSVRAEPSDGRDS